MFWNKHSEVVMGETYEKRLNNLETELKLVIREQTALTLDMKMLRDKVLRKIQFKKSDEEEEETNIKDPYKGILLPEKG